MVVEGAVNGANGVNGTNATNGVEAPRIAVHSPPVTDQVSRIVFAIENACLSERKLGEGAKGPTCLLPLALQVLTFVEGR